MGFFQDFTGASARKDLESANARASTDLKSGYDSANRYYDQAYDEFTPYAGGNAMKTYDATLGLGTPDERTAAQDTYFGDPVWSKITSDSQNAMLRGLNARGLSGSGVAAAAGSRIAYEGYGGWQDRLRDRAATGFQASTARAGVRSGQGDTAYNYGATKAGMSQSMGNAMAQSRSTLSNNLLSLAGTAAKAYAGMPA